MVNNFKCVRKILHEDLAIRNLSEQGMARLLFANQKRNGETTSQLSLDMYKCNPKEFPRRFMTVDGTRVNHSKTF